MEPEWPEQKLGDLARIEIGGTPSRHVITFWAREGGHPWLSIADLCTKWVDRTAERITDAGVRYSNVKLIPAGTPVMSFKLSIGRVAILCRDMYSNEAIAAFHVESDRVNPTWLYYELLRAASRAITDTAIKGATLNKAKLRELTVKLPSIAEQRHIAEILDTLDEAIRKTEEIIAKLEQVKHGLLHDLLTHGIDDTASSATPSATQSSSRTPGWD